MNPLYVVGAVLLALAAAGLVGLLITALLLSWLGTYGEGDEE